MATFIILRLLPDPPTDTNTFNQSLQGLSIKAWDRSVNNTSPDPVVGANDFLLGEAINVANPDPFVDLTITPGSGGGPPSFDACIIQHWETDPTDPLGDVVPKAVATALIVVNVPTTYQEYPASTTGPDFFDVRFEIQRNGIAIPDLDIEYNILTQFVAAPIPTSQFAWTAHAPDPSFDYVFPTSAYIHIPPAPIAAVDPSVAFLNLGKAGQPPSFGSLVTAIDKVLTLDSPATARSLATLTQPLTIAQCAEIASEIVYNRIVAPPPEPSGFLENLYTVPDNQKSPPNSGQGQTWDSVRQTWEGNMSAYRSSNDSNASKLAGYIFAASAAVWAELQTYSTTATVPTVTQMARISVILDPALTTQPQSPNPPPPPVPPPPPASVSVVLTSSDPSQQVLQGVLNPAFVVPASYFYALGAKSPPQLSPLQRYKAAVTASAEFLDQTLQTAIASGYLDTTGIYLQPITQGTPAPPADAVSEPQAVRRLTALSAVFISGSDPRVQLTSVSGIIGRWLQDPSSLTDFNNHFWGSEISSTTVPSDYFMLLLNIITGGNTTFTNYLLGLPITTSLALTTATDADWTKIFTLHPEWLPLSTAPGNTAQRTSAFLVFLRKLLTVGFAAPASNGSTTTGTTPGFDAANDVLSLFFSNDTSFTFGPTTDPSTLGSTLSNIYQNDALVQQWVLNALTILNNVYSMTSSLGLSQGLQFSYMEALYARGLTSPDRVVEVGMPQLSAALAGTVAYNSAQDILTAATGLPHITTSSSPWPGPGFQPVNGGDLVNCIPPEHLSPLGPVQYLFEMLAAQSGTAVLGDAVAARRGSLGNLSVTELNLRIQLPMIDMVIESLENIGSLSVASGVVYDTEDNSLSGIQKDEDENTVLAIPQYSSPSLNIEQPGVYKLLNVCFTNPQLPYTQTLDVCRSYLHKIGTSRFETMRCFRQDITEFPGGPAQAPADFQAYRWRYPVAFDVALEFVEMSEDEYSTFYNGSFPASDISQLFGLTSTDPTDTSWLETALTLSGFLQATGLTYCEFLELWKSGFITFSKFGGREEGSQDFSDCPPCCLKNIIIQFPGQAFTDYPQLLSELMYFIRLWRKVNHQRCRKIPFATLADICAVLGLYEQPSSTVNPDFIRQLVSLIMLVDNFGLPWGYDASVTTVGAERTKILSLWTSDPADQTASDWAIKHLLEAVEKHAEHKYHCQRREAEFAKILKRNLNHLSNLAGFDQTNTWNSKPTCTIRFIEVLAKIYASTFTVGELIYLFTVQNHLDGDDPFPMPRTEEAYDAPLHLPDDDLWGLWALRRKLLDAEICDQDDASWTWLRIDSTIREMGFNKVVSSNSSVDTLTNLACHFFPKMMEQHGEKVTAQARRWITPLPSKSTSTKLWSSEPCRPFHYDPSAAIQNSDFSGQLWVELPVKDTDVSRKLRSARQLNDLEIRAVQNLYFAPRAMLAPFAMIFSNFDQAVSFLVQESDEKERFKFFRRQFALFHRRCKIIAEHLACHVDHAMSCETKDEDGKELAWRILQSLIADENFASQSWEDDTGAVPTTFNWDPHFSGNAFAAVLGLIGTGLYGKYDDGSTLNWTEMRGPITAFSREEDEWNTPVLTVIPPLAPGPTISQQDITLFKNGFILSDAFGEAVTGSQPFEVEWVGFLLIDKPGMYDFCASQPTREDGLRLFKDEGCQSWIVTIARGQKTWTLLNHGWEGEDAPEHESLPVCLSGGAWRIVVKFRQKLPENEDADDVDGKGNKERSRHRDSEHNKPRGRSHSNHPRSRSRDRGRRYSGSEHGEKERSRSRRKHSKHSRSSSRSSSHAEDQGDKDIFHHHHHEETGFQLRYKGPDTGERERQVPFCRLIRNWKTSGLRIKPRFSELHTDSAGSSAGAPVLATNSANQFLDLQYFSTLRDIRRTYQRAFKAVLFARRFCLSARLLECDWQSELGFMLDHPDRFEGAAYYLPAGSSNYLTHYAYFDFNLLPVSDVYGPKANPIADLRANPTPQRQTAMFDWWERVFDYTRLRQDVKRACGREAWLLFEEVATQQPSKIEQVLRHLGVNLSRAEPLITYFASPTLRQIISDDLLDERWAIRIWHANRWIEHINKTFFSKILGSIQPALWASDDPGTVLGTTSGNQDLVNFVQQALLNSGHNAKQWDILRRLNDNLRERARKALLAYLCGLDRVPLANVGSNVFATTPRDLSDLLLQDVEAGLLERSSRIEDAIHAVQTFVQRVRLGLEPSWTATPKFTKQWERRFSSFDKWRAWKRRQLYKEKWLVWDEMQKAENKEGFKSLLSKLPQHVSTLVKPGRPFWWSATGTDPSCDFTLVQTRELTTFGAQHDSDFEGLSLMGEPLRDGRPTLLAPVTLSSVSSSPPPTENPSSVAARSSQKDIPRVQIEGSMTSGKPKRPAKPKALSQDVVPVAKSSDASTKPAKPTTDAHSTLLAAVEASLDDLDPIPMWISSAIRLGARFIRVAAAGKIPAVPYYHNDDEEDENEDRPCCKECGKEHDNVVDEYYFWLQDSRYFKYEDAGGSVQPPSSFSSLNASSSTSASTPQSSGDIQNANIGATSAVDPQTAWEDVTQLPALLPWQSEPMVHLFWTRVHMKTLDPPRRSTEGLPIDPTATSTPALSFSGRNLDSLYFTVSNSLLTTPGTAGAPATIGPGGFRYDLTTDGAVLDPGTLPASNSNSGLPTGFASYPNFIYFEPGKPLFPASKFGTAMAIAESMRLDCNFDCALEWCRSVFDPTLSDNTWEQCSKRRTTDNSNTIRSKLENAMPKPVHSSGSSAETSPEKQEVGNKTLVPEEGGSDARPKPVPRGTASTDDLQLALTPVASSDGDINGNVKPTSSKDATRARFSLDEPCCPCGPVSGGVARARAVVLQYLQILLYWSDTLMRRDSVEFFQQALVILNSMEYILGPTPPSVNAHSVLPQMTVADFTASPAPLNPQLMELYASVRDRLDLVHQSCNAARLRNGLHHHEPAAWGSHLRWDKDEVSSACGGEMSCWSRCQPYRFTTMMSKAQEWASLVKTLGSSLLTAYEKGDAEYLATMRSTQDRQIMDLGQDTAQNQWRAADWDVQALEQSMESALTRLRYYKGLLAGGLNAGESGFVITSGTSMESRAASQLVDGVAQDIVEEPDTYIGGAGAYGTPVNVELITGGTKQAYSSSSGAKILNTIADAANTLSSLQATQGGWDRRTAEWQDQVDVITIEIQQIKRQQLASWRRRHIALRDLNNHQQQMEHSAEVQDFLRDKFSKQELYLFLQQETASLYRQAYDLAMRAARETQEAFYFERADTSRRFLDKVSWDSLHEGLMAGDQLEIALHSMEQAYMQLNCREYELTKQFSLLKHFPLALLALKTRGVCEISIPEWLFDLDYPGHYLRRIRSLSLSVPCVAGPYTGVHARVQLLSSSIRYRPLLVGPVMCCCKDASYSEKCHCPDQYLHTRYSATSAIATSTGIDDAGLFELSFSDERYLPFEFSGAVSTWRIELPPDNNEFDFDSISDVILKMNYTAREGGEALRREASLCAQGNLPGNGVRYFDLRHEFQDAWRAFVTVPRMEGAQHHHHQQQHQHQHRDFELRFGKNMFPFLTGCRVVRVRRIHLFIEMECDEYDECERTDHICVSFHPRRVGGHLKDCGDGKTDFVCRAGSNGDRVYHGWFDVKADPIRGHAPQLLGKLRLPGDLEGVKNAYLLVEYRAEELKGLEGAGGGGFKGHLKGSR